MRTAPVGYPGPAMAYSYIRFSHPDQRRGNSLRRQLARSRKFAESRRLPLDDSLRDLARSAFHNRHTETGRLALFLELVRNGDIRPGSYLLIESFDRLTRDEFWPAFDLVRDILRARIIIVTLPADNEFHEYSFDAINKNPRLIHEIINDLTRGSGESKMKSERCIDAWEMQRQDAIAGRAKIPGRCPAWLSPVRGTIRVPDEEEPGVFHDKRATVGFTEKPELVAVVRLIFQWAIDGMGCELIANRLNGEKRPSFGKVGWQKHTVLAVLRNKAVLGHRTPMRVEHGKSVQAGPVIEHHYPEIIDRDTFYLAQGAIDSRNTGAAAGRTSGVPNLLRRIGRCVCGEPLHYVRVSDRPSPSQRYLICKMARRDLCENHTHYYYDSIEDELLLMLPLIDLSRFNRRSNSEAERGAVLDAQITEKSEQLTALARRKMSLEIERVMDELTDELDALRADHAAWAETQHIAKAQASHDNHAVFVDHVSKFRKTATTDDERIPLRIQIAAELRRLIDVAEGDGNTLTIRFKPAAHFRIEIVLTDQTDPAQPPVAKARRAGYAVKHLALWSRDITDPDYPNNPLRPIVRFHRDALLDPANDFIEQFGQYTAAG
jgi:DNA invertase Pin-like site-specific DNA recombinase